MAWYSQEDVFILAIRRSGNHAIANWLIPHYQGIARYLNDFVLADSFKSSGEVLEGNPTYLYLTTQGNTLSLLNKGQVWTIQEFVAREFRARLDASAHIIAKMLYDTHRFEQMINELALDHLTARLPHWIADDSRLEASVNLFGCENHTPEKLAASFSTWEQRCYRPFAASRDRQLATRRTFIVILRNPLNNLASLMRKPSLWPPNQITVEQFPATWIAYAQEFLGETAYLASLGTVVFINYDRWFDDEAYRRDISAQLARSFTDAGLEKVSPNGEGSSFDQLTYSHHAQQMRVLERWKTYQHDPSYRNLLNNQELLERSIKIYGDLPFQL